MSNIYDGKLEGYEIFEIKKILKGYERIRIKRNIRGLKYFQEDKVKGYEIAPKENKGHEIFYA